MMMAWTKNTGTRDEDKEMHLRKGGKGGKNFFDRLDVRVRERKVGKKDSQVSGKSICVCNGDFDWKTAGQ